MPVSFNDYRLGMGWHFSLARHQNRTRRSAHSSWDLQRLLRCICRAFPTSPHSSTWPNANTLWTRKFGDDAKEAVTPFWLGIAVVEVEEIWSEIFWTAQTYMVSSFWRQRREIRSDLVEDTQFLSMSPSLEKIMASECVMKLLPRLLKLWSEYLPDESEICEQVCVFWADHDFDHVEKLLRIPRETHSNLKLTSSCHRFLSNLFNHSLPEEVSPFQS